MAGVLLYDTSAAVTTYVASIISVTPDNGALAGGMPLTITGVNFLAGAAVTIGGTACANIVIVNDTTITCDSPAKAAGTYNLVVTNAGQAASPPLVNAFTYYPAPTVTAIFQAGIPNGTGPAAGGNQIEVRGTGFLGIGAGPSVYIDLVACTDVEFIVPSIVVCIAPAHVAGGPYDVQLVNDDADTQSGIGAALYTYV